MRRVRLAGTAAVVAGLLSGWALAPALADQPDPVVQQVSVTAAAEPVDLIDISVTALRVSPPFFQVPRAPLGIDPSQTDAVVASLQAAGTPIYVVILPGSADRAVGTSREIQQKMGLPGTYLSIVGTVYDTYSTEFSSKPVLTRAFAEQRNNGTAAVITRFAELCGQAAVGPLPTPDVVAWRPTLIVIGLVLLGGAGYLVFRTRVKPEDSPQEHPPPPGAVDVPSGSG
jgi:hypothetical protein